ncbi:MAG: CvpA family protein [Pseudomonadota bacterium]|nr:CvpA family protein [Pseudomonadota bacterium]
MFQILDFVLFGIMLISGLLAMARGLVRELLSLAAWGLAIVASYYALHNKQVMDLAGHYFDPNKPIMAQVAVGAGAFVVVFIFLSLIGMRMSDRSVASGFGVVDRTLGLIYGGVRGLVLVSVCYIFYVWAVPGDRQEDWIKNAASLSVITNVSEIIKSYLPPQIRDQLSNADVKGNGPDTLSKDAPATAAAPVTTPKDPNYSASQQQGLGTLSKNAAGQDQKKQ